MHTCEHDSTCLECAVGGRLAGDGSGSGDERLHLVLPLLVLAADRNDLGNGVQELMGMPCVCVQVHFGRGFGEKFS